MDASDPRICVEYGSSRSPSSDSRTVAELYEQRLANLKACVNDLENRLKLNSTNSSKPPFSDPIGIKRKPPASPSGKKRGGQPGHRKAHRVLVPPKRIRETTHCKPTDCRRCGHELSATTPNPWPIKSLNCPRSSRTSTTIDSIACPALAAARQPVLLCLRASPQVASGPYLQAVLAMLAGAYRLSKRHIQQLVSDLFTLSISTGMVSKLERQSAIALEAPYNELATLVHTVNIDETSWRENRRKAWLWATVTSFCTVFTIAKSRSGEVATALLGSKDDQVVGSDRFSAYEWIKAFWRQVCWCTCTETSKRWSTEVVKARELESDCFRCRTGCSATGTEFVTKLCLGMCFKSGCTACVGKASKPFWKGRSTRARKRRSHALSFSR